MCSSSDEFEVMSKPMKTSMRKTMTKALTAATSGKILDSVNTASSAAASSSSADGGIGNLAFIQESSIFVEEEEDINQDGPKSSKRSPEGEAKKCISDALYKFELIRLQSKGDDSYENFVADVIEFQKEQDVLDLAHNFDRQKFLKGKRFEYVWREDLAFSKKQLRKELAPILQDNSGVLLHDITNMDDMRLNEAEEKAVMVGWIFFRGRVFLRGQQIVQWF